MAVDLYSFNMCVCMPMVECNTLKQTHTHTFMQTVRLSGSQAFVFAPDVCCSSFKDITFITLVTELLLKALPFYNNRQR